MTIEINIEWFNGLNEEQQKAMLYAIFHYYQGRVVAMPLELQRLYYSIQIEIDNKKKLSDKRRQAVNKRWNKNTNDTNIHFVNTKQHFVDTKNTNVPFVNTKPDLYPHSDPQPLTPPALPELPLAPAPTHVINPSHSLLPTNNSSSIYNNILYNKYNYTDITDEDINTIRQIIDAYNDACDKQNVVDIIVSLLHQQAWLARPLLSELTAYLLLCDTARKENYMSVETRLMQAFSTMNKNIETLRQSLLQSVAQNWRTLVPPKQETQYGSNSTKSPEAISRGVREGLALARANKQRQ